MALEFLAAIAAAVEYPFEATCDGLDNVPGIEGLEKGFVAEETALRTETPWRIVGCAIGYDRRAILVIGTPGICPEVKNGKHGHLHAK